jgi:hypothetical protein
MSWIEVSVLTAKFIQSVFNRGTSQPFGLAGVDPGQVVKSEIIFE